MALILPLLIDPCSDSNILSEVDSKIKDWSKSLMENIRFGQENKINYTSFEGLLLLRDIYINKVNCADWLDHVDIQDIIQALRRYTKNCN